MNQKFNLKVWVLPTLVATIFFGAVYFWNSPRPRVGISSVSYLEAQNNSMAAQLNNVHPPEFQGWTICLTGYVKFRCPKGLMPNENVGGGGSGFDSWEFFETGSKKVVVLVKARTERAPLLEAAALSPLVTRPNRWLAQAMFWEKEDFQALLSPTKAFFVVKGWLSVVFEFDFSGDELAVNTVYSSIQFAELKR